MQENNENNTLSLIPCLPPPLHTRVIPRNAQKFSWIGASLLTCVLEEVEGGGMWEGLGLGIAGTERKGRGSGRQDKS